MTPAEADAEFLTGGGGMGERVRAFPWDRTPLGAPGSWPQGLRTAVRVLLTTHHPVFIFWGAEHTCLYNDAYSRSLGPEKHPSILGAPARAAFTEIWPIIEPQIAHVLGGHGSTWHENQLVPIFRHGALEDVYWTYSYSPIDDPSSAHGVGGVLVIVTETTEHMRAQRQLGEERERFVQLFDQAPTFLALLEGPEHVYTFANRSYLRLVGDRSLIGRKVADALPEAAAQGYVARLDEVYRTGVPYAATGSRFAFQVPGGPVDEYFLDFVYQPMTRADGEVTGILVQGVDATARANADRALAVSRSRLDFATRLSGVGFWYCDLPFDELDWDERVKEHFFYGPTERITMERFYARIHEEDRAPTRAAIDTSIRTRTPYDIVYRTVHPQSGEIKWIRALGGADYASDGTPMRFDGVTVDVSPQKRDAQRLSELNLLLREQDRRKDEFIATLSHELRNPLAPIRAAARVIASPELEPDRREAMQSVIERQVNHMALLLDDLLDIARITQRKVRLDKVTVSLRDVLDATLEVVSGTLDQRGQALDVRLPPEPVLLEGDPLRLSQILTNLLANASKYSEAGLPIGLRADVVGTELTVAVEDRGVGIAPDFLPTVFEMFSQSDTADGRGSGGLGIGLALVKGLTELHGGTVEARSAGRGLGSEFVVRLPIVVASHAATDPVVRAPAAPAPRKVLVADDNRDAANGLAMLLQLSGNEVEVVYRGSEVRARAAVFRPDTAVLDIGMPDRSGYDVARDLRGEPWGAAIHLIALTGWGQESDRRRALEAGFDDHLVKPVDPDVLEDVIRAGRGAG